jgi:cytochrome c biogenesis protein CcmG/thiol:disulfide interchange protein DsbE
VAARAQPAAAAPAPRAPVNRRVLLAGLLVVAPLLAILLLNLGRDPHAIRSPLVGRAAPAFSLVPVGGGPPVTSESLKGRPLVLNFWATWCAPCLQEHGVLVRAASSLRGEVQFLGVVYEDTEDGVRAFLARHGSAYPSLLDPDAKTAIAYGVAGVPETYFIDAAGVIQAKVAFPLSPEMMAENIRKVRP